MSNVRRRAYLEAMGIDVWQHRVGQRLAADAAPAATIPSASTVIPAREQQAKDPGKGTAQAPARQSPAVAAQDTSTEPVTGSQTNNALNPSPATAYEHTALTPPETARESAALAHAGQHQAAPGMSVKPPAGRDDPPTLAELQQQAAACTRCELHTGRLQSVFGDGNPRADWMFVGEAPGAEEDRQGLPFVGPAGQLLNAMLTAIGLQRDQVYIANLVKCRPPRNRDPKPQELVSCQSFINAQLAIIQPRIIIALGRFAAQSLIGSTDSIGRLRTGTHTHAASGTTVIATYHPAYLLRSPVEKSKSWRDLLRAREIVRHGDSR